MSTEISVKEAARAWADEKQVQAIPIGYLMPSSWFNISKPGVRPAVGLNCFGESNRYRFRIAPEPPAKRYRQWTQETAPIGFVIRKKRTSCWWQVYTVFTDGVMLRAGEVQDSLISFQDCLAEFDHTTDGGKTWLPCGEEVES